MDELERHFQSRVIAFAKARKWMVFHVRNSIGSEPGFPDLIMLRGKREVVAELKKLGGKRTPEQVKWLQAFAMAGRETFTWWPTSEDWQEIVDVLT